MPRVTLKTSSPGPVVPRRPLLLAVIVGAVLVVLLALIFISPLVFGRPYFVVYTTNGEIFVGKASWFPKFNLTDAYIVQSGIPTPDGGGLQLVPLKDTPWSPKKLYFEKNQVVFYGPIDGESNVANALKIR